MNPIDRHELASALTDGAGILLSVTGGTLLVTLAALTGDPWKIVGVSVFVAALVLLYIGMGWMVLVAAGPLWSQLDLGTMGWLVAGGLAYTGGTVFYHSAKAHHHAVWHLFVIAGSLCHGVAVGLQVWV